jgi:RNA recognition motif-containing protein
MSASLRVGGLSNIVLDADLIQLFQPHGVVLEARIIPDAATGLGSGSGRVEMRSDAEALAARSSLNGAVYLGRTLTVTAAEIC